MEQKQQQTTWKQRAEENSVSQTFIFGCFGGCIFFFVYQGRKKKLRILDTKRKWNIFPVFSAFQERERSAWYPARSITTQRPNISGGGRAQHQQQQQRLTIFVKIKIKMEIKNKKKNGALLYSLLFFFPPSPLGKLTKRSGRDPPTPIARAIILFILVARFFVFCFSSSSSSSSF